ncbi:MAG: SDR family oxidoreductase [Flavobacteriaceae bacterium]|nr:SDR family oxidoreductase [Flavobacteriaceae bacterium]
MILVTGGTGLVGTHLLASLVQKHDKIRAIKRKNSNLDAVKEVFSFYFDDVSSQFSKIEWIEADITDVTSLGKAFEGVTYVYHVAALVSFNPKEYYLMRKINIEGTANIVNFSIAQKVTKLCFVSSIAAIDKTHKNGLIDETGDWTVEANNYGYAITKYGAEMEVWRGTQEGLDAVIVNPGIILGSGCWNTSSGKIFTQVAKGLRFYTEGVTGYVSVKDVVKSMVDLMESNIKNERYILVAENRSLKDVLFFIADAFGKKRPSIKVTTLLAEITWRLLYIPSKLFGTEAKLTKQTAKSIHNKYYFSNNKIKEAIDIKFEPIDKVIKGVCANYKK